MPTKIQRKKGQEHPAPFPVEIPRRLIAMYTFGTVPELGFSGDIVLDMFNGSGSTCVAAAEMSRNFIGIDISIDYCKMTERRIRSITGFNKPDLIIDKIKMPSKAKQKRNNENDEQTLFVGEEYDKTGVEKIL
jgi:DNA modification methylase